MDETDDADEGGREVEHGHGQCDDMVGENYGEAQIPTLLVPSL